MATDVEMLKDNAKLWKSKSENLEKEVAELKKENKVLKKKVAKLKDAAPPKPKKSKVMANDAVAKGVADMEDKKKKAKGKGTD